MYRRKYQRKRGVKRALVMLLTFVMLVSVCLPAMQVSAEEVVTVAEIQLDAGVYEQLLNKLAEAKEKPGLTAEDVAALGKEISDAYESAALNQEQYAELSAKYTELTVVGASETSESSSKSAAETTTAPSEAVETTTAPSETVETTTAPSETVETTTAPSEPEETKDPVQGLLDRLLGTSTYEELHVTEEDQIILSQFTAEQNAALYEHISSLSDESTELLADLSVKQGETATFPNMRRDDYEFEILKDGQTISSSACGIEVTNAGNKTIQVATSSDTPVGTYTIRYGRTEYWFIFPHFDEEGTFTLAVTEEQSTDAPVTENKSMTYDKTVIANGDGTYNLALTLSGAVGTATNPAKVDIVLVIDKSGSMEGQRLSRAKTAAGTLINALNTNEVIDARYNIVTFSGTGRSKDGWTMENASSTSGWTGSASTATGYVNGIQANGATNYEAGLLRAQQQLGSARSGATTIVVFLTDGLPTIRCSNYNRNDGDFGYGYGTEGHSASEERCLQAAIDAVAKIAMNRFYVIGTGTANSDNLSRLANGAALANYKKATTTNDAGLDKLFADIAADISTFLCENVAIKDTLRHVDGELMVKVTDPKTVAVTVYDGDAVIAGPAKTVELAATETNNFNATLEALYDETKGVLELKFPETYKLEPNYTYKLSAVIAPTEKAYEEYRAKGYDRFGEDGTGAHAGQPGFRSNDEAIVTYTYNGTRGEARYKHPVVQLNPGKLVITKSITGLSGDALTKLQEQLSFDVSITYPGKEEAKTTVSFAAFNDSDGDGVYTFEMTGLSPDTDYSVTEKNAAVANYNVTTKINGVDDEDASTSGKVARGQTVTVAYVNDYTIATTEISVTKTVSGNMGDQNEEFTFTYKVGETGTEDTFSLKHGQTEILKDLTIGETLYIKEVTDYVKTVTYTVTNADGTQTTTTVVEKDGWYQIPVAVNVAVSVNNTKNANIDTGVTTDSIPYVLLLTMAVIGAGALLLNKRRVF